MDSYFANIYDYVQQTYGSEFRIFTPPMAQANYAELKDIEDPNCLPKFVVDRDGKAVGTGYTHMFNAYYVKNDGITWHNYFVQHGESITQPCPVGWHISSYFPSWMADALINGQKIGIVAEADLCSPNQCRGQSQLSSKGVDPNATALSLKQFFANENKAKYIIAWLLSDDTGNTEHDWHEAYKDDGTQRQWVAPWWSEKE